MAKLTVKPIYLLKGNDSFLRSSYREQAISAIVGDSDRQLCVSIHSPDAVLSDILDDLRSPAFLAPRRAVILNDADSFVTAYRSELENYFAAPSSVASLILIVSSMTASTKIYKIIAKIGTICDCSCPKDPRKVTKWIAQAASKRDKTINTQAARQLLEYVGPDLSALGNEIDKLAAYVGDSSEIKLDDVDTMVTNSTGPNRFDLPNAIDRGNVTKALQVLDGMLTKRGDEFAVLGLIAWHLRKTFAKQSSARSGASFRKLIQADLAMKSGTDPVSAIRDLVVSLCSAGR
ncbi:MAG TPA: DNA polymerase III subunit delta [Phycisphaerae bacterium]|nr:DNA polymerase III subunit delta [Phycisphaerae bacterium]